MIINKPSENALRITFSTSDLPPLDFYFAPDSMTFSALACE
jgi:hypothetical protein